jgi:hypothetical protein
MSQWINLKEELPKPETTTLFWVENDSSPYWRTEKIGHIQRNEFGGYKIYIRGGYNPNDGWRATHWMPLPEPPKQ